jgi:hypothetical protein
MLNLVSWPFVVVGVCDGGSFLSTVAGRAEMIIVMVEVVVVVGCSAASTACFHLEIGQNMPRPL